MTETTPVCFSFEGRLGNLLIGLSNALFYAETTGTFLYLRNVQNSCLPDIEQTMFHPSLGRLVRTEETTRLECSQTIREEIYWREQCSMTENERRRILQQYVVPFFSLPFQPSLPESHLVIHIRSGDIFQGVVHPSYLQPPLEYYRSIIEGGNYSQVTLVTEKDQSNPVVQILLEKYPKLVCIQSETLAFDVAFLMAASHLMIGVGSFAYTLSLCSQNLRRLYCFESQKSIFYHNSPYEIIVLGTDPSYPTQWKGCTDPILSPEWKIRVLNMTDAPTSWSINWETSTSSPPSPSPHHQWPTARSTRIGRPTPTPTPMPMPTPRSTSRPTPPTVQKKKKSPHSVYITKR